MKRLSPYQVIQKKRDGKELSEAEIKDFIMSYTDGEIPDYQMSALLMAIYLKGMTKKETAFLTKTMLNSGVVLNVPANNVIDKHSTGGVGDKASFILAPIVAAAGVRVPMISGRGLGHTGGTLDKLDVIKNINTAVKAETFTKQLMDIGLVFGGQTKQIAPADRKIYALRDVTGTIESVPLITASIMSKKLAEGVNGLVFDVKTGSGAFMSTKKDAKKLATSLKNTSLEFNKDVYTFITDMSQPLGNTVGHSIEVIECLEVLKGKGPKDLTEISLELSAAMIHLGGGAKSFTQAKTLAKKMIKSGKALEKFREAVVYQGGDPSFIDDYETLPKSKHVHHVLSPESGYIKSMDSKEIGLACITIGGGRNKKEDKINFGAGFEFHAKVGTKVKKGQKLLTIYHCETSQEKIDALEKRFLAEIFKFSRQKPLKKAPLIIEKNCYWTKK